MVYKLLYTRSAENDLDRLPKDLAVRILKKLDEYVKLSNPFVKAKKL